MILKIFKLAIVTLAFTACFKTRSEIRDSDQTATYGKKAAQNQIEAAEVQAAKAPPAVVDEKDELIRTLNGRVEALENQISILSKSNDAGGSQQAQKVNLMQEALTKLETQMQKLEDEVADVKSTARIDKEEEADKEPSQASIQNSIQNSTQAANGGGVPGMKKSANNYEVGQRYFATQEWKKAILSFNKYVDESPKGKNIADAKYRIGICFQELGLKEEAMAFFEEVVANYAKSEAGKRSKIRLAKLKK